MANCECGCAEAAGCQCSVTDTDCIEANGAGTADNPFSFLPIIDPDANNLLECGAAGMGAFLPPEIANPPCCSVYHSTAQSIPSGVGQILAFNLEEFDTDSMHDIVTANSRITFNTAGVYWAACNVRWDGNAVGDRRVEIRKNGATTLASNEYSSDQADEFDAEVVMTPRKFAAGDYIEVICHQNSGSSLNIQAVGDVSPRFGATRVAVG